MEARRDSLFVTVAILSFIISVFLPATVAQSAGIAPAPAPTSDGTSIDQGIAYLLMLVALMLTYFIH